MKDLKTYLKEAAEESVYVVYMGDGTMVQYFADEQEAKDLKDKMNKESSDNKAEVKKEKKSNFER